MQEKWKNCCLTAELHFMDPLFRFAILLEWYNTADIISGGCFHGSNISQRRVASRSQDKTQLGFALQRNCQRLGRRPPLLHRTASYKDITSILTGKLNPMTAMMTSKLKVKGSLGYMMRNVPTVLDFVRVAQEVTKEIV
jgi:hypothetical protein